MYLEGVFDVYFKFLNQLTPIFGEDTDDWLSARRSLRNKESVKWHASAGLDWTPTLELASWKIRGMHQTRKAYVSGCSGNSLFVFSDYSDRCLTIMKRLYEDLDDVDPDDIGFLRLLSLWTNIARYIWIE